MAKAAQFECSFSKFQRVKLRDGVHFRSNKLIKFLRYFANSVPTY
jgi:hypothetical protein